MNCPLSPPAYVLDGICYRIYKHSPECKACPTYADPATAVEKIRGSLSAKPARQISPPPAACRFLGKPTGNLAVCAEGCGRGVKLKLFECAIFSTCTIYKISDGCGVCCRTCNRYTPPTEEQP